MAPTTAVSSSAETSLTSPQEPVSPLASPTPGLGTNRLVASRSCNACNVKKVRCDRREPCARCERAGKPCTYPPVGPRIRRTKKTIMAEMASRLSSLEKSIASGVSTKDRDSTKYQTPSSTISGGPEAAALPDASPRSLAGEGESEPTPPRPGDDILVQRGSSSQYFNDIILSKVIGSEQNIESALTTPRTTSSQQESPSPFNVLGLLSAPCPMQPSFVFHPPKQIALKLWSIYSNNEDSVISLKVLHRPTDEAKVFAVIDNPSSAPHDHLALCFAVYFSATVSLRGSVAESIFGSEQQTFLFSFKKGIEQAFAQGDFLDNPTVTGLQALVIYLSVLRQQNRGKGMWILNGLSLRIAQSLGLHRDGTHLGLPPFESEIRRRLWWLMVLRDGRAVEDYGLKDNSIVFLKTDVKHPLNVDDIELYPGMKSLPQERNTWTPMTWSLSHVDVSEAMQKIEGLTPQSGETTRRQIMSDLKAKLEERFSYCNPLIPRQLFVINCGRFIYRKLDFITRQRWFIVQNPGAHHKFATEENLSEALDIIYEGFFTSRDELLSEYEWSHMAYPQYHMTLYVLWHLCLKPEGPDTERAWEAMGLVFSHLEVTESVSHGLGSKAIVLKALRTKAESAREKAQRRIRSSRDERHQTEQTATPENMTPCVFPLVNSTEDWANYSFLGFELQDWTTWTQEA